jgi:hypothetical protein
MVVALGCGRTPLGHIGIGEERLDATPARSEGGADRVQVDGVPRSPDVAPVEPSRDAARPAEDAASVDLRPPDSATIPDAPPAVGGLAPDTRMLAVSQRDIYELDRDGKVLRQRPIPDAKTWASLGVFGAAATGRRLVHIAVSFLAPIGTGAAVLTLDLASGSHAAVSDDRYRLAGLVGAFGIATSGGFVFAANNEAAPAMFRFDPAKGTHDAVAGPEANRYGIDVSRGRDDRVYLLTSGLLLASYDPRTLAMTPPVHLEYPESGIPIRGVAVDGDRKIFAAAQGGRMLRFTATGHLELSVAVPGVYWFHDVDIDADGRVIFGSDQGELVIADRALTVQRRIALPVRESLEIVVVE